MGRRAVPYPSSFRRAMVIRDVESTSRDESNVVRCLDLRVFVRPLDVGGGVVSRRL